MSRNLARSRSYTTTGVAIAVLLLGFTTVLGQTVGQDDLDEATQLKLNAGSMADLDRVVELCESALEKGLDDESAKLAKALMTATLFQQASRFAQRVFNPRQRNERWPILKQFAIRKLEKALKFDDNLPEAHLLVARLHALSPDKNDREKGKRSAERAVELFADEKPSLAKALVVRAGYRTELEQRFADLDRAIELDPSNLDSWRARGMIHTLYSEQLSRQRKPEEAAREREKAIADFIHLIEENPQDLGAHQLVADLFTKSGNTDDALSHIQRVIKINPESPAPYYMRARIHRAQKKLEDAIRDLDRAVDLAPDNYQYLLERSQVH